MTFTVRIYDDESLTSHTDHTVATEAEAYALVYNEPIPLPESPPMPTFVDPAKIWFDIYNSGVLYYSTHRVEHLGESL